MSKSAEIRTLKRVFFILIVSLSILTVVSLSYIYQDTKRDQINDLAYKSSVIKKYYELSFQQWELSLLSVGKRLTEINSDSLKTDYIDKALDLYSDDLLAFGLARPDGQVEVFSGNIGNEPLPNLKATEQTKRSFEATIAGKGITLGEVYFFGNVQDWILPIRVPIRDESGNLLAVNTSAIAYSSMVEDLESFGFTNYTIHLINARYQTTQILYPLEKSLYKDVLSSSDFLYTVKDSTYLDDETYFFSSTDPMSNAAIFGVSAEMNPVNHCLFISVEKSFLWNEVVNRFRYVVFVYLVLIVVSVILYNFLRNNLKRANERLNAERANLKAIIESTDDIIGLFDTDLRLLVFNNAFVQSARATDDMELHEGIDCFSKIKSKEHAEAFRQNFQEVMRTGKQLVKEMEYPGPDDTVLYFRFTYNPVYENGKIHGISMFAENTTEIKKYQTQLEEYNQNLESTVLDRTQELENKNTELESGYKQLKSAQQQLIKAEKMASLGVLAAGIGHEINNPLNFIKHGASSLQIKLKKSEGIEHAEFDEYFYAIDEGVKRATDIVQSLSHFSRTGDKLDEKCDMHEILKNCIAIVQARLRDKTIKLTTAFHANNPVISGNDGKLHQVFTNLLVNAEQAITEKGEITISTESNGQELLIKVEDTGEGIPEEIMNRISDPFFTTKDPGDGTGLGLFISYQIIDEHEGKIEVKSEVGQGTAFSVSLNSE